MISESQELVNRLENETHLAAMGGYLPGEDIEELSELAPEELARIHTKHQAYLERKAALCEASCALVKAQTEEAATKATGFDYSTRPRGNSSWYRKTWMPERGWNLGASGING